MMAVAALHVLTPSATVARELDRLPEKISELLAPRTLQDGLGNSLRIFGSLSGPAADELVRFGQLQVFEVAAYDASKLRGGGVAYFAPFNVPAVSLGSLSPAAWQLWQELPV